MNTDSQETQAGNYESRKKDGTMQDDLLNFLQKRRKKMLQVKDSFIFSNEAKDVTFFNSLLQVGETEF